jgi:hypothetical protein
MEGGEGLARILLTYQAVQVRPLDAAREPIKSKKGRGEVTATGCC